MSDWIEEVGREIADPAWFAGLLESLVGAGIALAVAVWILRRQLAADRQLRVADHRAEAGHALGRDLLRGLDIWDGTRAATFAMQLREPRSKPPGADELYEALRSAEPALGDLNGLFTLWRQQLFLWEAARASLGSLSDLQARERYDIELGNALDDGDYCWPAVSALQRVAHELIRWDGLGAVPGAVLGEDVDLGSLGKVPMGSRPQTEWLATARDRFASIVRARWSR